MKFSSEIHNSTYRSTMSVETEIQKILTRQDFLTSNTKPLNIFNFKSKIFKLQADHSRIKHLMAVIAQLNSYSFCHREYTTFYNSTKAVKFESSQLSVLSI